MEFISVCFVLGVETGRLVSLFGSGWRVVRAMPNTAVSVGEGATVYCLGPGAEEEKDGDLVTRLFSSVGLCTRVQESQIGGSVTRTLSRLTILSRRCDGSVWQRSRLHVHHHGGHG